mmetsp:Transcript_784/g.1928  ORF Transcript_784/g.1928 Transcript_784/m.1928 type:complete len:88 (-) Transcript_784:33-296(-)
MRLWPCDVRRAAILLPMEPRPTKPTLEVELNERFLPERNLQLPLAEVPSTRCIFGKVFAFAVRWPPPADAVLACSNGEHSRPYAKGP